MKDKVLGIIQAAIAEYNEGAASEKQILPELSSVLYGRDQKMESLDLVELLADIEERVDDELSLTITIASDRAMSQKVSPFKTVETLRDYVAALVEETQSA